MTTDPAAMLREHLAPAGSAIVPERPITWRDRYAANDWCGGELRALYVRADKKWTRTGYVCLRCGTVELHAGVLPVDLERDWRPASKSGQLRERSLLVPGWSNPAATTPAAPCPDCGELVTTSNLARHRRRRHSATSAGVDTAAAAATGVLL